ncbi:MAG: hypothetical protein FJX54_21035 [Alphaproteobacteria bacterium]|nr:hypothetical protein [Alphaproteobacteria bacterium]
MAINAGGPRGNHEDARNLFVTGYGPTKMLYANAGERKEDLKRDFIAFHDKHRNDIGVAMAREYLVTLGRRR